MLRALKIRDFAVIDEVEVEFGPGLTVLTGETGAGKSIVVDALSLLLGGRADVEVIRTGAEEASVEGCFERSAELLARLESLGLPDLGCELLIRRVVGKAGRAKAYVNGSLVTVGVLARLMKGVVDIAGQHEHVSLFDPAQHLVLLDRSWAPEWGPEKVTSRAQPEAELSAYAEQYEKLLRIGQQMNALGGDEQQARQRADFLRYQLDELIRVDPRLGEDDALEVERKRLSSAQKLRRVGEECEAMLVGNDGAALEVLHRAIAQLQEAARLDPALERRRDALSSCASELEAVGRDIARYAAQVESNGDRLAEVEERLDLLKKLCRKHARDTAGLCSFRTELEAELVRLDSRQEQLEQLSSQRGEVETLARALADQLTARRKKAAQRLGRHVSDALSLLAMPKACFEVRIGTLPKLSSDGLDAVEFFFSANPGEAPKPIAKVASGGEASRVLLAVKRALAGQDHSAAYVLDEADSGVSGAVAEVVGRLIKEVSEHRQVLCITHLPQVAAYAEQHLLIKKEQTKTRTRSLVVPLSTVQERTGELARMLSGVELTREAQAAAEALVRSASRGLTASRRVKKEKRLAG